MLRLSLPPPSRPCRDGPETFAVPDIDQLPGMEGGYYDGYFGGGGGAMEGGDAPLPDDLLPVPSGEGGGGVG